MPGLTFDTYKTQIAEMAVVDVNDINFLAILPSMIDYAELRIARDLDLMITSESLVRGPLVAGNRKLDFTPDLGDESYFVVSEQLNLILPIGEADPEAGTRVPLLPTTKEFLDAVCGSSTVSNRAQPKYYAPFNETLFFLGPVPDAEYYIEVVGTVRATPLSESNPQTFISKYLPDLLIMASMIYISAYQRNFGRQSDDPQMAQSYEAQYKTLLVGAATEEARKKYEGPAWSSQSPSPIASPTRG